ncbi:SDR family NAD(P)-dependent oxidoreductase [Anaeromyxobacter sp. Fw109-5]|uniref:SDR family NAD(P)-dependent oxidoreductase n=1 Tax=Anaeromyxobacter sp. (strain Fw109-5) TaxID=404589 RepID=UPI0000ED7DF1|nr:SDR family NAD(P)-dependent oxidoreductase [Anaeromyxobacter sp. Fw109-5]ABS25830.1 oxidoreductase [Anaeromyxobacter sp. Fw109-5]
MSERSGDERAGLSGEEVAIALRVLARVAADRTVLAGVDAETRTTLQKLAGEVARPDLKQRKKLQRALLRDERVQRRARDEALRKETGIQQLREAPVFSTPLPELPRPGADASGWWPRLGDGRAAPPPPDGAAAGAEPADGPVLSEPRKCYVCKAPYDRLHRFYDQLCRACGDENYARRAAAVDLRGRVALVTGARVKIGYQAAILLLRAGCTVVACTRFPRDAAARYAREPDFDAWKDRLRIHGIDLRHTPSVELLAQRLAATLPRLDFQIHNACQTVRRPPGFYAHLLEREEAPLSALPEGERALVREHEELKAALADHRTAAGVTRAALLSQATSEADLLLPGRSALELFPRGVLDADLQQVDLRAHNSWRLALHEVPTLELLEVLLVNATAPFVMTARLKPLMLRDPTPPPGTGTSGDPAKHVVLVSAMEGQFYREHKTDKHPHTNMAKAALNMIVRTSASDYARDGIHLNAVDTGWVTDEDPAHLAARKAEEHAFSPPLDVVDGAARIVAPIFEGFRSGRHPAGLFFKDYRPTPW